MKQTKLIWLLLIILMTATPPTWAQVGPIKQQESKDAITYFRLGVKHLKANRYIEAVEAYKQAIRLQPDFAGAYYNLGYVYDELGRYKEVTKNSIWARDSERRRFNSPTVVFMVLITHCLE